MNVQNHHRLKGLYVYLDGRCDSTRSRVTPPWWVGDKWSSIWRKLRRVWFQILRQRCKPHTFSLAGGGRFHGVWCSHHVGIFHLGKTGFHRVGHEKKTTFAAFSTLKTARATCKMKKNGEKYHEKISIVFLLAGKKPHTTAPLLPNQFRIYCAMHNDNLHPSCFPLIAWISINGWDNGASGIDRSGTTFTVRSGIERDTRRCKGKG